VPVDINPAIQYLWWFFCELSNSRGYSEAGPMSISFMEIDAWARLTRMDPTAWEISVIKQIDRAFLSEALKK
jgi:hypothetical protein